MWPFARRKASRFAAARVGEPAAVEARTRIASPNVLVSPITGTPAALLVIELCELLNARREWPLPDDERPLGTAILGDMLTLADEAGAELSLLARHADYRPRLPRAAALQLAHVPPELVPFLGRATGGILCYRETSLQHGAELLLKAIIEPTAAVQASGYRDGPVVRYLARDDLGAVVLEELPPSL